MIHLLNSQATPEQVTQMLEAWELTIKLAVDIERQILAGGGSAHADCEAVLLADGSQQKDVWGASYIPEAKQIRYDSVINIRPRDNNHASELQNPVIRGRIAELIKRFLEDL